MSGVFAIVGKHQLWGASPLPTCVAGEGCVSSFFISILYRYSSSFSSIGESDRFPGRVEAGGNERPGPPPPVLDHWRMGERLCSTRTIRSIRDSVQRADMQQVRTCNVPSSCASVCRAGVSARQRRAAAVTFIPSVAHRPPATNRLLLSRKGPVRSIRVEFVWGRSRLCQR